MVKNNLGLPDNVHPIGPHDVIFAHDVTFAVPEGTRAQSKQFLRLLREAWELHLAKSAGYSGHSDDVWVNFRTGHLGVDDEKGIMVRLNDKWNRLLSLDQNPDNDQVNEPIEDVLRDIAAYCYIRLCIRYERAAKEGTRS